MALAERSAQAAELANHLARFQVQHYDPVGAQDFANRDMPAVRNQTLRGHGRRDPTLLLAGRLVENAQ